MTHSLVVDVVRTPEFRISLEQFGEFTFGHVEFRRWSHAVFKRATEAWETIMRLHGGPIYVLEIPGDPRQPRFVRLFGFRPAGRAINAQGESVVIYERTLDGQPIWRWEDHHDLV